MAERDDQGTVSAGVTLNLSLGAHPSDLWRVEEWVRSLVEVDGDRRLLLASWDPVQKPGTFETIQDLCAAAGVSVVDAPAQDDVVVVGDVADLPGPSLVARLAHAARQDPDGLVDARTLPVELSTRGPATEPEESSRLVSGVCVATSASLWSDLGAGPADELVAGAERAGRSVVCRPEATVVRDIRLDDDGSVLRAPRGAAPAEDAGHDAPPSGHPAALPSTSLGRLLETTGLPLLEPDHTPRPFLTVVTRTQGTRPQCLAEMFACLAMQTVRDFEVVLACHRVAEDAMVGVRRVVDAQPEWLRARVRLIEVLREGRSAPLNDAWAAAEGRYTAALDDDDTVLPHWVETFRDLEAQAPGTVLRTVALRQDIRWFEADTVDGTVACPVSMGTTITEWPLQFSLIDHLRANYSPFMTVAFPRGVFHELGHRFDEDLATTEDWAFLVSAAAVVGVTDAPELTSVYRWWLEDGSHEVHDEAEWERSHEAVRRIFEEQVTLLPAGSASRIGEMQEESLAAWAEVRSLATEHQRVIDELHETVDLRDELGRQVGDLQHQIEDLRHRLWQKNEQHEERLALLRRALDRVARGDRGLADEDIFKMAPSQLRQLLNRR